MRNNAQIGGLDGPSLIKLIDFDGDSGILRPIRSPDGVSYVTLHNAKTGKRENVKCSNIECLRNTTATLPYEVWLQIDQQVTRAAQSELRAVEDLRSAGLVYNVPNGFATMALMTQRASRIGTAHLGMDPMGKGVKDRPVADTVLLPLPCIWADWGFGARELAVSKRGGLPLDMAAAEDQARACAELAEKMLIGNSDYDQYQYVANAKIWGYTDFTSRVTGSITAPSDSGWVGQTIINELLAARQDLYDKKMKGPFVIYMSKAWSEYIDDDYAAATAGTSQTITIRERILKIDDFSEIRHLDYLTGWDILIVGMRADTVREVIGMEWTPVQWEEQGGQVLNWRILGIMVPQIRADYDGNCGICHLTTS